MAVLVKSPPCVVHEDPDILVVNKPAGFNTHSPTPYAGEGLFEWLRNYEARWADLAIIHRLDKATSGLIVFGKSRLANRSLTAQFTDRKVHKRYLLLASTAPAKDSFIVRSGLVRVGEKYAARQAGDWAETKFEYLGPHQGFHLLAAEPLTGRTHQIRVHCELSGIPILGDTLYGGVPFPRVCLHAETLRFHHPDTGHEMRFHCERSFFENPALALRRLIISPSETSAYRVAHGAADKMSLYLERWGDFLLAQSDSSSNAKEQDYLRNAMEQLEIRGVYQKLLNREVAKASKEEAAPKLLFGTAAPSDFVIRENSVQFEISFEQGYSVGLFLDQRENRRRLLKNYVGPGFHLFPDGLAGRTILNTFAYTCGFSVCAALAGAHTTSLDLSRKYLEWGERNFRLNKLDPEDHDFIHGDTFEWAQRLRKKARLFDLVILDPPTFSRGKHGVFQAERDFPKLVATVLPLIKPGGLLFASTNIHKLPPENFVTQIDRAIVTGGRKILQSQYVPQPADFPVTKEEPAFLKTLWNRIE